MIKGFKLFNLGDFKTITDKMTEMGLDVDSDEKKMTLYFNTDCPNDDDGMLACGIPYSAIEDVDDDVECDVELPEWLTPANDDGRMAIEMILNEHSKYGKAQMREQFDIAIDEDFDISPSAADVAFKMIEDKVAARKAAQDTKNDDDDKKSDDSGSKTPKKSKSKKINLNRWATTLITQYNAKLFNDNQVYTYNNGGYNCGVAETEKILQKLDDYLKESEMKEIHHRLEVKLRAMLDDDGCDVSGCTRPDSRYIRFKTKIYDTQTKELINPSSTLNVVNRICHDYDPNAPVDDDVEKFLSAVSCGCDGVRELLIELLGYILYYDNPTQKIFIMVGDGANGKTTFEKVIKKIIGARNTSNVKMKEFDDRFRPADMVGKLCNIGDDIGDGFIKDASNLKVISGDGEQIFERKYQTPFSYTLKTKILFSANKMPRVNDKTHGWMRRLVIIPLNARFSSEDGTKDPDIDYKLQKPSAVAYWIRLAIEGLHRLMERDFEFEITEEMEDALREYEEYNNPALAFLNSELDDGRPIEIEGVFVATLYAQYKTYCIDEGLKPLSKSEFNKQVKALGYNNDHVNTNPETGKQARYWAKN